MRYDTFYGRLDRKTCAYKLGYPPQMPNELIRESKLIYELSVACADGNVGWGGSRIIASKAVDCAIATVRTNFARKHGSFGGRAAYWRTGVWQRTITVHAHSH